MSNSKIKVALASFAVLALGGFTAASATSLALQANNDLSAGTSVTASCQLASDGDITVAFSTPVWNASTQEFTVNAVNLGNISEECDGYTATVVVAENLGTQLGTQTVTLDASGATTFALPAAVNAEAVASVSVVVY